MDVSLGKDRDVGATLGNGTAPTGTPEIPTSTTSSTIPPTTSAPYKPCPNHIIILFDSSETLNQTIYTAEAGFLANYVLNTAFTHFERLALALYNVKADDTLSFGYFTDISAIHQYIIHADQVGLANISAQVPQ